VKLAELENYFNSIELPKEFKLNNYTFIKDIDVMVNTHISILKANIGNVYFKPYHDRLVELYNKLTN
jgi:hypothetical protein